MSLLWSPRPHLDDHQHLAELAVDLHVAQPDDVVAQERDRVRAERQLGEGLDHLDGAHDRDAGPRQRPDHPVERLAEVGAEAGGQGHLEAGQRIDHHPLRARPLHRVEDLVHRLVDRQVERPEVDDVQLAVVLRRLEIHAEAGGPPGVLLRAFLEDGDDPRLAPAEALGDELGREDRLSRPRRPGDQQAVALGDAAAHHRVQLGDPGREPPPVAGLRPSVR